MKSRASALVDRILRWWESFWFTAIPPFSFGLLRIVFGLLGLFGLIGLTPVDMYWPLDGINPLPGGGLGLRGFLHDLGYGAIAGWGYFFALAVGFVCMAVGFYSRWAVAVCLVGSVAQKSWNNLPLTSAHEVLIVALFCLVWADTGRALSLDTWLASRRKGLSARARDAASQPIWPLRLLQVHVALIYLNSGLWKLFGESWRDGSAVYYAVSHNIFHRFPIAIPPDAAWVLALGTYVTLLWEITFPVLVLSRWTRPVALVAGVLVHGGIWATIEVGTFSWVMVATYIAFLDPWRVAGALQRWRPVSLYPASEGASSVR